MTVISGEEGKSQGVIFLPEENNKFMTFRQIKGASVHHQLHISSDPLGRDEKSGMGSRHFL